eukprot:TRINITY_DN12723_c0_g2_i1.p1 TRINITY_DN12723_c0_g2~~TRINITY_DN12723_c0_g2_i1.p1  ORF type:complete len:228 (+),score=82.64 TRINITY_DN12723_c0_g2_i1:94-684(+)
MTTAKTTAKTTAAATAAAAVAAARPPPPATPSAAAAPATNAEKTEVARTNRWGARQKERTSFFDSIDGAPKWAEAPTRPEAGGKELVLLKPKEERGEEEGLSRKNKKSSIAAIPAAAKFTSSEPKEECREHRCRRLLRSLKPSVEDDIIDYLASLVGEEVSSEDLIELRETAIEILEGHGVSQDAAEVFWSSLLAG